MSATEQPVRVRKNLLGDNGISNFTNKIRSLDDTFYEENNLTPVYQRDITWSNVKMNDFIATIMDNGLITNVILYQLAEDQRNGVNEEKTYETVDGQHRLTAIKAFKDSTYLKVDKKDYLVCWKYENTYVFYKRTDAVEDWCRKKEIHPQYLTKDEKKHFDNYDINFTLIKNRLSLDYRSQIFLDLQKNAPVRGSDLHKNLVGCKFTAYMRDNGYEKLMKETFFDRCNMKTPKFWVEWNWRLFLLYKHFAKRHEDNDKDVSEIFLITDKQIQESYLDKFSAKFNTQDISVVHAFDTEFRSFIKFIDSFGKDSNGNDYKLGTTQIFALFYIFCDKSKNPEIMLSHIPYWSKETTKKSERAKWKSDKQEPRREHFNAWFAQIQSVTECAPAPKRDERPIKKVLRKRVWTKCVDGKCEVCKDEITEKEFEAGHIVARALGGKTELTNLIPICFECNRGMGTRHAREYQKDVHPEKYAKYITESESANQEI